MRQLIAETLERKQYRLAYMQVEYDNTDHDEISILESVRYQLGTNLFAWSLSFITARFIDIDKVERLEV